MAQTKEIDLKRLGGALLRRFWVIILCAVVVGTTVFFYTDKMVPKQYKATVKIYVTNRSEVSQNGFISSSDLASSQRLVVSYIDLLYTDLVLDTVVNEVGREGLTSDKIRGMISAESPNETEVLTISVVNSDPELAKDIANAIVDKALEPMMGAAVGSTATKLDNAKNAVQCAPNVTNNTIIGAAVGILIAVVGICLQVLLDVRVKGEEDLARLCDAPVLGNIPDFNFQGKASRHVADSDKMGGM